MKKADKIKKIKKNDLKKVKGGSSLATPRTRPASVTYSGVVKK